MDHMNNQSQQRSPFAEVLDRLEQLEHKFNDLENEFLVERLSSLENKVESIRTRVDSLSDEDY